MPKIFIDFLPAEVKVNREVYVAYHVVNPLTGKMERKRIRLNHIHGKAERVKYARALASVGVDGIHCGIHVKDDVGENIQNAKA